MACIYIVCGRNNLFKVGLTSDFKSRLTSLRQEFKRFGNDVISAERFDEMERSMAWRAEFMLLNKFKGVFDPYCGREWFVGDSAAATEAARITSGEYFFHKPYPEYVPLTEEECAIRDARRAAYALERKAQSDRAAQEVAERRALREQRRAEIAERQAARIQQVSEPS